MLDRLSQVRDSVLLLALAAGMAVVAAALAFTIGPEYSAVPLVLGGGSAVFGVMRRRDGD